MKNARVRWTAIIITLLLAGIFMLSASAYAEDPDVRQVELNGQTVFADVGEAIQFVYHPAEGEETDNLVWSFCPIMRTQKGDSYTNLDRELIPYISFDEQGLISAEKPMVVRVAIAHRKMGQYETGEHEYWDDFVYGYVCYRTPEEAFLYEVKDGGAEITGCQPGYSECMMVVPETLGGYPVRGIGDRAFYEKSPAHYIYLPDTVEYVGDWAFYASFMFMRLSDSLKRIGTGAFCASEVSDVRLPDTVTEIPDSAFCNCVFVNTDDITDIVGPHTVSIGQNAFAGTGITLFNNDTLPDSVTYIGSNAFEGCKKLEHITLPASLTEIGTAVFRNCSGLTRVSLPDTLTVIGDQAFYGCKALNEINMTHVTVIGNEAFRYCDALTSVCLGDAAADIRADAFRDCSALTAFSVSESNTAYCNVNGALCDKSRTRLLIYPAQSGNTAFTVPDTVVRIEGWAFNHMRNTATVVLPDAFCDFPEEMFLDATGLQHFVYHGSGLTHIPERFFMGCTSLVSPVSYTGVLSAGDSAFAGCSALSEIRFDEALNIVGRECFMDCTSLAGAYFGSASVTFGGSAFRRSGLQYFDMPAFSTKIESYMFSECASLEQVHIPDTVTQIGNNAFAGSGIAAVTLPEGLKTIASHAFYNTDQLTTVRFPDTLETLGSGAFEGSGLVYVTLGDNLTLLGSAVFRDCADLCSVVLGTALTSVPSMAFANCISLETVTFPEGLDSIGTQAFAGCTALEQFMPGTCLKRIEQHAFADCSSLTAVRLYPGTDSIAQNAFSGCSEELTMQGWNGSYASKWAEQNQVSFMPLDRGLTMQINTAGDGYIITGCDPDTITVQIPARYNGLPVLGIRDGAFAECVNLSDITAEEESEAFSTADSILYDKSGTTLLLYPANREGESFVIGSNVSRIGPCAFAGSRRLNCVFVADTLTDIGTDAFTGTRDVFCLCGPEGCTAASWAAQNNIPYESENVVYTYVVENGYAVITGYTGTSEYLIVPSVLGGYPVRVIRSLGNSSTRCITVSEGIEEISESAFADAALLEEIYLPDSLTVIGNYALAIKGRLSVVRLGSGLISIGDGAFTGCGALKTIELPEGLESIGAGAFSSAGLTRLSLPSSLKDMGDGALTQCQELRSITAENNTHGFYTVDGMLIQGDTLLLCISEAGDVVEIPEGVKHIGNEAFWGDPNCLFTPDQVIFPSTLVSIGVNAFSGCGNLTGIELPDSLETIGSGAFVGCRSLRSVNIPEKMTQLESYVFQYCTSLEEIDIQGDIDSIGMGAFYGCDSMASLSLPASVRAIDSLPVNLTHLDIGEGCIRYACDGGIIYDTEQNTILFVNRGLTGEVVIADGIRTLGDYAFSGNPGITSVTIPDSVTSIGEGCFSHCTALAQVHLPTHLQAIGEKVFYGCSALSCINWPESLTFIGQSAFRQTALTSLTFAGSHLTYIGSFCFFGCEQLESINITCTDLIISEYAFANCTALVNVTLPEMIGRLDGALFYNCTSLREIILPRNTTCTSLFSGCTALERVVLPTGLTGIDPNAFDGCVSLREVNLPEEITYVGDYAFRNCKSLTDLVFPASVRELGNSAFAGTNLTEVIIPEGFESVPTDAFAWNTHLTRVVLPSSLKVIGDGAFRGCSSLKEIELPAGLTAIGGYAFDHCEALKAIDLPEGLTELGPYAFEMTALNTVTVPSGIEHIGDGTFMYCYQLKTAYLSEGVQDIGIGAFADCTALETVDIASASSIGQMAFYDCTDLTAVRSRYPAVESIGAEAFMYCGKLECVDVSDGLRTVGDNAFLHCFRLVRVSPSADISGLAAQSVETIGEWAFYKCALLPSVQFGNHLTKVGEGAFHSCQSVREFIFPDSVSVLGDGATNTCTSCVNYRFPEGLTRIPTGCIGDNNNISSLSLPAGVRVIGVQAFYTNKGLGALVLPDGVTEIEDEAFAQASMELFVPSSVHTIAEYAFDAADIVIRTPSGSYAEQFALSHGLRVINTDTPDTRMYKTAEQLAADVAALVIRPEMDTFEKAEALMDWLLDNITYDNMAGDHMSAKASFMLGRANDWGWSMMYEALLSAAGIDHDGFLYGNSGIPEIGTGMTVVVISGSDCIINIVIIDGNWYFVHAGYTKLRGKDSYFMMNGDICRENGYWIPDETPDSSAYRDAYLFRKYGKALAESIYPQAQAELDTGKKLIFMPCENVSPWAQTMAGMYMDTLEWYFDGEVIEPAIIGAQGGYWFAADLTGETVQIDYTEQYHAYGEPLGDWYCQASLCGYVMSGEYIIPTENTLCSGDPVTRSETVRAQFIPELSAFIPSLQPVEFDLKVICMLPAPDSNSITADGHTFRVNAPGAGTKPDESDLVFRFTAQNDNGNLPYEAEYRLHETADTYTDGYAVLELPAGGLIPACYQVMMYREAETCEASQEAYVMLYTPDCYAAGHTYNRVTVHPADSAYDGFVDAVVCCACGEQYASERVIDSKCVLSLPAGLGSIAEEAFEGSNTAQIVLGNQVTEIGSRAFAGCSELALVVIPDSVTAIADDAFTGDRVVIVCGENSYADTYAIKHGIPVGIID